MTILYIANSTKQNTIFSYRGGFADPNATTPANFRLINIPCRAGGQVPLFEGEDDKVSGIILQMARQGAMDVADLDRRQTDVVHAIFSIGKPVEIDKLRSVIARNDELMNDKSYRIRKNLAIATHYNMNERAQEMGPDAPRPHNYVQTIEEVAKPGDDAGRNETIEVATEGHAPVARQANAGRK